VTAVGGTNLETTYHPPSLESNYVSENAYGDPLVPFDPYGTGNLVAGGYWGSGGGESIFFAKPLYQYFVETGTTTRAAPDISLKMGGCPAEISVFALPRWRQLCVLDFQRTTHWPNWN
jgi:subtilase family serine protease